MNTELRNINLEHQSPTAPTVAQLVVAARNGDGRAFEALMRRYRATIVAVAMRRVHDIHEAEDVAQDTFIQAWHKMAQLREPSCFGGWIRRMADRIALNRAMRRKDISTESQMLDAGQADEQTPLGVALDRERADQVLEGMDRLGETDRETLHAFYFADKSVAEMSEQFKSPVGTIKRRLHVARKRLAKELDAMATA